MKKNLRKIPEKITQKIKKLQSEEIVVMAIKTLNIEDIRNLEYKHLEITENNGEVDFPKSIIPNEIQGKHSNWNINGREIKRKDLPLETYYNYVESPNWGDSYNGTHTVELPGKRYPIDFIPPRYSELKIELIGKDASKVNYSFRITLSEILRKNDDNFNERLLDCLNIIQENTGTCDVGISGTPLNDYLKTHRILWEILPIGSREDFVNKLFKGRKYNTEDKQTAEERYDFFDQLKAEELLIGSNGFQRYFGAKLTQNLVLFENTDYGNALYIMYNNWEELSQKSRVDLLSGRYGTDFDRIIHTGNWKSKVKRIIRKKLK